MSHQLRRERLTVSVFSGIVVPHDAISTVCRQHLAAITRYCCRQRLALNLKVYTLRCEIADARISVARNCASIAADEHFQRSDVLLYHYGIYYPLFDSIHFAPPAAKVAVFFHGITPPDLLDAKQRPAIEQSYRQAVNLHAAQQVLTTSQFLAKELGRLGIPPERIERVPLPPSFAASAPPAPAPPDGRKLRLVYVGRFVRSKGVLDALKAVAAFGRRNGSPLRFDLVGSLMFSDRAYLERLVRYVADQGLEDQVFFHFDVDQAALIERFRAADVLVMPSYHEGFCIPVIEAMACGCFVLGSDAGAVPETAGGLGLTFAAGDSGQLSEQLEAYVQARRQASVCTDRGLLATSDWQQAVAAHLAQYTQARCDAALCRALLDDLPARPQDEEVQLYLSQARQQAFAGLGRQMIDRPISPKFQQVLRSALIGTEAAPVAPAVAGQCVKAPC